MKLPLVSGAVVLATLVWLSFHSHAAEPQSTQPASTEPSREQFTIKMVAVEKKGDTASARFETKLTTLDGREASFNDGGEIPIDLDPPRYVPFGFEARATVHRLSPDRLRVFLSVSQSVVEPRIHGDLTIRTSALQWVREIKAGESVDLGLAGGWTVKATISD
jgi:hypothetical protein